MTGQGATAQGAAEQGTLQRIEKAVSALVLREPWYAALFLRLEREISTRVPTAATDGRRLILNPAFMAQLSQNELLGVLIHETLHCALLHSCRRRHRERLAWNWACDRVVNAAVIAGGYVLPPGCVPPAELEATAEEEYGRLPHISGILVGGIGEDVADAGSLGGVGDDHPGEAGDDLKSQIERYWKEALASAAGLVPRNLQRTIDMLLRTPIPWEEVLMAFVSVWSPRVTTTWSRPHRRLAWYPGHRSLRQYRLAVCIDTSGSISREMLSKFIVELRAISALVGATVSVLSADARVHRVYLPGEPWEDGWIGGGGTDFRPAISWAEHQEIDALIYCTDGKGEVPSHARVPILWVLTEAKSMPFGEHVLLR